MPDSSRIRLCERCWRPLSAGTVFRVFRHPEAFPPAPGVEGLSFRHLADDPGCTGVQVPGASVERAA